MNEAQEKIGHMLLKGLVALREQKGGEITLQDMGGIFLHMAMQINPDMSTTERFMHQEISRLAQYIADAKKEIFAISSNEKTDAALIDASQHLDEVIRATEEATHTIMDAADAIKAKVEGMGGDKEKNIVDAANRIYDSCNFQDITGQRITKVIKLLEHIDERIAKLNALFGDFGAETKSSPPQGDKQLMNGPQLSGNAATQAEIDQLFASLSGKK